MSPTLKLFIVLTTPFYCLGLTGCMEKVEGVITTASAATPASSAVAKESKSSAVAPSPKEQAHHGVNFYSVDHYDESRDPSADLAETVERAGKEKKRILIQVGGDWCGWCRKMSEFIETNATVRDTISQNFVIMKVTYTSDQQNKPFLSQYPAIKGYPHIYVLENDGTLLHSQDTSELEEGSGYSKEAFTKFLAAWRPNS